MLAHQIAQFLRRHQHAVPGDQTSLPGHVVVHEAFEAEWEGQEIGDAHQDDDRVWLSGL